MASSITSQQTSATSFNDNLHLDYEQTNEQIRMLTDIRFKLLAFVPTLTAVAVTLLASASVTPGTAFVVGLLGFFVTFAIAQYDLRNSQIYDAAIHRAKELEKKLRFLPFDKLTTEAEGGLWKERPKREGHYAVTLFGLLAWHDGALATIYSAALGGWFYIIAVSMLLPLSLFYSWQAFYVVVVSIILAIIIAALFRWRFHHIEANREKPEPHQ